MMQSKTGAPPRRPWVLTLVVGIPTVLALGWLVMELQGLRREVNRMRSQQEAASQEHQSLKAQELRLEETLSEQQTRTRELRGQLAEGEERIAGLRQEVTDRAFRPPPPPVVSSMVLSMVRTERPTLLVPKAADSVELSIDLDGADGAHGFRSFRGTLRTAAGAQVWSGTDLPVRASEWGREVVARVPARLLAEGDYRLSVEGRDGSGEVHPLGEHEFTVVRGSG